MYIFFLAGASQVKWNKLNPHLLASGHDCDVRVWDHRKTGQPMQYIAAHLSKIQGLDWSPNHENHLVTSSNVSPWILCFSRVLPDGNVHIYNMIFMKRFWNWKKKLCWDFFTYIPKFLFVMCSFQFWTWKCKVNSSQSYLYFKMKMCFIHLNFISQNIEPNRIAQWSSLISSTLAKLRTLSTLCLQCGGRDTRYVHESSTDALLYWYYLFLVVQ